MPLVRVLLLGSLSFLTPSGTRAQEPSLQAFLAHLRAERDARHAALHGPVSAAIEGLEQLGKRRPRHKYEQLQQALRDLGREATPLLLPYVDPGTDGYPYERFRAEEIALHLRDLVDASLTEELLVMARRGSPLGRDHALELLGLSTDRDRVTRALGELYRSSTGDRRLPVFRALVRAGGHASQELLAEALASNDDPIIGTALEALAERKAVWAKAAVRSFLDDSQHAARHVPALLAYVNACPEVADEALLQELLALAATDAPTKGHRRMIMEALPRLGLRSTAENRSVLDDLSESIDRDLRDGALVALAMLGDRGARRRLLRDYDDEVGRRRDFAAAYEERAAMLMRIGDYPDAARDYKKAIELRSEKTESVLEVSIELARAHALSGKLRFAADVLEDIYLGRDDLERLRADPDFAALRDHPRYGKVLALD